MVGVGWGWGSVALCIWVIGWGLMSHWRDATHLKHTCYFSWVIRLKAGNRQIWVMTSCEITWHCKRSIHGECSSKWPALSSGNHTVWIIQVFTLLVGSGWKKCNYLTACTNQDAPTQRTWVRHVWQWFTVFPWLCSNEHNFLFCKVCCCLEGVDKEKYTFSVWCLIRIVKHVTVKRP